jgi:hypothetical protein
MSASKLFRNFPDRELLAPPNDWNISIGPVINLFNIILSLGFTTTDSDCAFNLVVRSP